MGLFEHAEFPFAVYYARPVFRAFGRARYDRCMRGKWLLAGGSVVLVALAMGALTRLRHELRTPFNHILGYTAILLEDAGDGGFREALPVLGEIDTDGRSLLDRIQVALAADGGMTFEQLDAQAGAMSDNEAAQRLNDARVVLFKTIFNRSKKAA